MTEVELRIAANETDRRAVIEIAHAANRSGQPLKTYLRTHNPGLHLRRDSAAWKRSLVENPEDLFFGWSEP